MNKHLPRSLRPGLRLATMSPPQLVIAFLRRDTIELSNGNTDLRQLTVHCQPTLRATLVQAAEEFADTRGASLVSTRHRNPDGSLESAPRFWVDGEELVVRLRLRP